MIKCDMTNIYTNQRIKAKSVSSFCQTSGLQGQDKDANVHIYKVIDKTRFQHLGWCLSEYYNADIKLKDIYGNVYESKIRDFVNNNEITIRSIWSLFIGRKKIIHGLSLYDTEIVCIKPNPIKIRQYLVNTPNNKIIKANTIASICKQIGENGPSYRSMLDLKQGKKSTLRGYSIMDIKIEQRKILNEV